MPRSHTSIDRTCDRYCVLLLRIRSQYFDFDDLSGFDHFSLNAVALCQALKPGSHFLIMRGDVQTYKGLRDSTIA